MFARSLRSVREGGRKGDLEFVSYTAGDQDALGFRVEWLIRLGVRRYGEIPSSPNVRVHAG